MQYDLTKTFLDLEGKVILQTPSDKPFTLGAVLTVAGLNADPQKYGDGASKYRIYKLILRANAESKEEEISAEDVSFLKDLVGSVFGPYLVGVVYDALEQTKPSAEPPTKENAGATV